MTQAGDFIGNYRIIINLSSHTVGELYLVEHTFRDGPSMLLQHWTSVELINNEDRQAFEQRARAGFIQPGLQKFPIQDSGINNLHPYIVVPLLESTTRLYNLSLTQTHPHNRSMIFVG
ncbi:MAG TPA: hypothetical protein VGN34_20500 [Ktedonobacteraceae bacterium]|jgi:hypothetical protein